MNRRDVLAGSLVILSPAMAAPRSLAYPDRAIRLVVPFSPGGATDVVGRLWAEKMKPLLGTVVTENRGGGGGVTGATEVARAQPDGHTFLFGNTSTQVLIPAIMHNPPYDPLKDFVGIYILCNAPTSIVVHESVPARNLQELIAYARTNPGKLSYGSAWHADQSGRRIVQAAHRRARHRAHSVQGLGTRRGRPRQRSHSDDDAERGR